MCTIAVGVKSSVDALIRFQEEDDFQRNSILWVLLGNLMNAAQDGQDMSLILISKADDMLDVIYHVIKESSDPHALRGAFKVLRNILLGK